MYLCRRCVEVSISLHSVQRKIVSAPYQRVVAVFGAGGTSVFITGVADSRVYFSLGMTWMNQRNVHVIVLFDIENISFIREGCNMNAPF